MNTLEKFEKTHKDAINYINQCRTTGEPEMIAITNHLLETDANPYSFLPHGWAGALSTSTGFESLLHVIHHALFDDGEISFPIVNGEPRIAFVWKNEDDYADFILTETEQNMRKNHEAEYTITHCKDVIDFIEKHQKHHDKNVKQWFIQDSARQGVAFATEHYSNYAKFDSDWEFDKDVIKEIQSIRKIFGIVKNDGFDFIEESTNLIKKNKMK